MHQFDSIRNVAVIAHVDHGKTTLVDALLKQTHIFRQNEAEMKKERILDTNDLERERGITIMAKNCAIFYKDTKINIIDTPGHADFSGEVERTLSMADGALLIIDAQEGPMPQTRYVLKKALALNLKIIVIINKIDKKFSRVEEVKRKTEDMFLELATNEAQLDFPILYAVGRHGKVFKENPGDYSPSLPGNVIPLLEAILQYIPPPKIKKQAPFKMLISSLNYNRYWGRVVVGKIGEGEVEPLQKVVILQKPNQRFTIERVMLTEGLKQVAVEKAVSGDIASLTGIPKAQMGQTIADISLAGSFPYQAQSISAPTLSIIIAPNTSPFVGQEGEFVTSRQIKERLEKEVENNISLKVDFLGEGKFKVSGRGELHLSIFLETMRREGYEMEVSEPEVILKENNGIQEEPVEEVNIIVNKKYVGIINQEMGKRHALLKSTRPISLSEVEFVYHLPTRALIGLQSLLVPLTKGSLIFSSQVIGYQKLGSALPRFRSGALVASQSGQVYSYGLEKAQGRGITFVKPADNVYMGMIVGQAAKEYDIRVNVCKNKHLTNMRAKAADMIIQLAPPRILSLEQCLDFIRSDELLEITPKSLRLRKRNLRGVRDRRFQN